MDTSNTKEDNLIQSLYLTYGKQIYQYLQSQGKESEEAEDILQDIFLIALIKEESIAQSSNKCGWLYKTAYYYIKKDWTKIFKEKELVRFLSVKYEYQMPDNEMFEILDALERILNEKEFQYIYERFVLDKSHAQMAQEQNKSVTALTSYGNRIFRKIRKIYHSSESLKGEDTSWNPHPNTKNKKE